METSEKILKTAYDLFRRYGIRSVTMDEIAGQCGVSKKTVYQFFADKESLVASIMESMIHKVETNCCHQIEVAENAIHEIFLSMEFVQKMMEGVNPALIFDLRKYHNDAYQIMEKHKKEFMLSNIKTNIARGVEEGLYRPDFNTEIIALFQLNSMSITLDQDIFNSLDYPLSFISNEIQLFLLYGLVTPKGAKLIDKYNQKRTKPTTL